MSKFGQKGNVSDEYFMIHIVNDLPEEYDVILDGLENHLTTPGDDALNIDSIHKKMNQRYKKIKAKTWVHMVSSTSSGAGNVASMATNLLIEDVLKIKMKKKKIIRNRKI